MKLTLDPDDFRPLVEAIVQQAVKDMAGSLANHKQPDRMLSEQEAAALFSVEPHVLRDARKRGELEYHRIGKFVRYDPAQINAWKCKTRTIK